MITAVVVLSVLLLMVFVVAPLLITTANRLDRLHVRTDAAFAGLLSALTRRAAVARTVAAGRGSSDLALAADAAEQADRSRRLARENALTVLLSELSDLPEAWDWELLDAQQRIVYAENVYNEAVRATRALRMRRWVRLFRLAGTAPLPEYFRLTALATVDRGRRRSGRVVLLDDSGRVLLFHGADPARPAWRFWFTPGGGVEQGESLTRCAVRELWEETGFYAEPENLLGPVWVRRVDLTFDNAPYHGEEWFFVLRSSRTAPVTTDHFTDLERATITDHRWWTVAELRSTSEEVYPAKLAELLEDVQAWNGELREID